MTLEAASLLLINDDSLPSTKTLARGTTICRLGIARHTLTLSNRPGLRLDVQVRRA